MKLSKYTTEVKYICEQLAGLNESVGGNDVEEVIQKAIPKLFDFDFPVFDETYRNVLEAKILRHYYTREIGLETYGLWKLKLNTKLNDIMPYYNQLYKSELIKFNPMYDVDIIRVRKTDLTGNTNTNNNTTSNTNNKQNSNSSVDNTTTVSDNSETTNTQTDVKTGNFTEKYSDTPQGAIADLESGRYLTNATIRDTTDNDTINGNQSTSGTSTTSVKGGTESSDTSSTDSTGSSKTVTDITNTEQYIESVQGKQGAGNYSEMLLKFRETFLNIDMLVINDLSDLFFSLW